MLLKLEKSMTSHIRCLLRGGIYSIRLFLWRLKSSTFLILAKLDLVDPALQPLLVPLAVRTTHYLTYTIHLYHVYTTCSLSIMTSIQRMSRAQDRCMVAIKGAFAPPGICEIILEGGIPAAGGNYPSALCPSAPRKIINLAPRLPRPLTKTHDVGPENFQTAWEFRVQSIQQELCYWLATS